MIYAVFGHMLVSYISKFILTILAELKLCTLGVGGSKA
jgi:hypothetical protein